MRDETIAIHGGYTTDPGTKVAVPIYQTVAHEFDSADHGAALFDLEAPGNIYARLSNPTVGVLEERVAQLEGGVEALCVGSGIAGSDDADGVARHQPFPRVHRETSAASALRLSMPQRALGAFGVRRATISQIWR